MSLTPAPPVSFPSPAREGVGAIARTAIAAGAGTVLAVFERSFYLQGRSGIACVGVDLVPGPLNLFLRLERFPDAVSRIAVGAVWRVDDSGLFIDGWGAVSIEGVASWEAPTLDVWRPADLSRGLEVLREHAEPVDGDVARSAIAKGVSELRSWLTGGTPAQGEAAVLSLLGCGIGLTPAGDDVLVGALVAADELGFDGCATELKQWVRRHARARTSAISAAHLEAALSGEAVLPVHQVIHALARGDEAAVACAVDTLKSHGASSGADALAGIECVAIAAASAASAGASRNRDQLSTSA